MAVTVIIIIFNLKWYIFIQSISVVWCFYCVLILALLCSFEEEIKWNVRKQKISTWYPYIAITLLFALEYFRLLRVFIYLQNFHSFQTEWYSRPKSIKRSNAVTNVLESFILCRWWIIRKKFWHNFVFHKQFFFKGFWMMKFLVW